MGKKLIRAHVAIVGGRFYKCNTNGIIDWMKTQHYPPGALEAMILTAYVIEIHKYRGCINVEHKRRFIARAEADQ